MSLFPFTTTSFNISPSLFLTILVSTLVLLILTLRSSNSKHVKLPPGPPGWPVVGNLFQFARSKKQFYEYVDDVRNKYGPIFTLRMGSRTMIIISDSAIAHDVLIQRGPMFATRPSENPTRTIFSSNTFTVNASAYGPVWRSLRRNM
ncbi:PREDICTED: cytochrome P450 77A4-like, partial [Camelina sativa]